MPSGQERERLEGARAALALARAWGLEAAAALTAGAGALAWVAGPAPALALGLGLAGGALLACAGLRRRAASPQQLDRAVQRLTAAHRYEAAADLLVRERQHERALPLYLHSGPWQKAVECYIALGKPAHAAELLASHEEHEAAARFFVEAEEWARAAESLLRAERRSEAAELLARAGEFEEAAEILFELGEFDSAAGLFERAGHPGRAAVAVTRAGSDAARRLRAANLFEKAGEQHDAARCYAALGEWEHAAELFDGMGQLSLAAQAFERGGHYDRAAERYAQAGWVREARANYEKAGDLSGAARMALQLGQHHHAGRAFYELGAYDHALEALQRVTPDAPHWRDSTLLMARIFHERNLLDRAAAKLESLQAVPPRTPLDLPVIALLAQVREASEDLFGAQQLLEILIDQQPEDPDVLGRLEALQDRIRRESHATNTARIQDRYELIQEIGRGGMGIVYLAQDRELERAVAIKFPPQELADDEHCLAMFRREARAAAAMNHPNIVQIHDVTVIDGQPCIIMEYVQGQTLRRLLRDQMRLRGRPLPPRRVAEIARDLCRALAYAHHQSVIHRDVKPSNVIVSDRGLAKLMDFGVSKILKPGPDGDTSAQGTPQYMAPENFIGGPPDGRADLYALGIAIFEAITAERPFDGPDVTNQQLNRELPDPRTLMPDLPDPLAEIVLKACQKLPGDRFQSAREMADALSAFLKQG